MADEKATENPAEVEPAKTDEPLGEPGLKALQAEREARAEAEKQAKELAEKVAAFEKAEQEKKDAELSEVERARKEAAEATAELERVRLETARLGALAKYPVPEEYQDLVTGTDAETFEASAKKLHELHTKATVGGGKELFDHSMPSTGKTPPITDGSYEYGAEKARKKIAKK